MGRWTRCGRSRDQGHHIGCGWLVQWVSGRGVISEGGKGRKQAEEIGNIFSTCGREIG